MSRILPVLGRKGGYGPGCIEMVSHGPPSAGCASCLMKQNERKNILQIIITSTEAVKAPGKHHNHLRIPSASVSPRKGALLIQ